MLGDKKVAVVVPAFNESAQVEMVVESIPSFVDRIVVVNDNSQDKTEQFVMNLMKTEGSHPTTVLDRLETPPQDTIYNKAELALFKHEVAEKSKFTPAREVSNPNGGRIILINHLKNAGVGAAIATGYKWCKDHLIDCTAVMAGDGQMDPGELLSVCKPIIEEGVDYVKGNRLIHRSSWSTIPRLRFFGNSVLSILTKVASGYWHVSDTQTGFTAISHGALQAVNLHGIYKSYGMPNDMLIKLNIAFCSVKEVEIKPVYGVGEKSKMRVINVIPRISWLLLKSFFKRLWVKYLFRDFHPLFLLYHLAILLFIAAIPFSVKIIKVLIDPIRALNPITAMAFVFLTISGFQSLLFAMWMDMQDNERLYK